MEEEAKKSEQTLANTVTKLAITSKVSWYIRVAEPGILVKSEFEKFTAPLFFSKSIKKKLCGCNLRVRSDLDAVFSRGSDPYPVRDN